MSEPPKQRSDPLVPLPGLLAELAVPIEDVLAGTGLVEEALVPNRFFELSTVLTILENAVALTGREDFGLLLGAKNTTSVLGPLSHVVRAAPTLGEALLDLSASQDRNTSGAATYLRRQANDIFFGYGVHRPGLIISPITQDLVLATLNRIVTELTRGAIHPREYLSMRPMPRSPGRWSSLGAEVHFGAAETGFYLSLDDMAFPLPTADPQLRARAMKEMLSQPALDSAEWTHRTRRALRALLLEGNSGMPKVARHLDIGPRSLRRALAREGTSFEEVRDAVRLAIARDLLSMSKLTIADLALTLDFSNPSAFIRAFRRWTGETPAAWRDRNGGGPSDPTRE
ncbi:helix-turn-helix domain-containing protein [Limibaculum sp. M0105]|uniref:Helix-turn-helix domain-containing protein n=1 Tax=Thermohalobaculum xanthum TaxID=2753746 RepID=A0A8J7M9C5_9RHOB|nr:AraC family transcriptional regulator [Thermohalobaculum xanthum]MBK0401111.1 helix-turn-helix domain-containing protein [Thermohalobaculum xanthum]